MSLPSVGAHAPRVGGHALCRSDLHAKSLGEGGEFLSNVWLLISLIGGRTLADKLQMPDDDPEPEGKVGEAPARDNKEEQKAEQEAAAGSRALTLISDNGLGHFCRNYLPVCLLPICRQGSSDAGLGIKRRAA